MKESSFYYNFDFQNFTTMKKKRTCHPKLTLTIY